MWPWKRQDLADRLGKAEGRLTDAESTLRLLKGEWLDTLDRLERMVGRIVKRGQRDGAILQEPPPAVEARDSGQGRPGNSRPSQALLEVAKRRGGHA